MRKSYEWAGVEFVKRGKRLAMTPLSTKCRSSTLKESNSWDIFGVESSRKDGEPFIISHEGYLQKGSLMRAYENASSGKTHYFVSPLQLLYDRVLRN